MLQASYFGVVLVIPRDAMSKPCDSSDCRCCRSGVRDGRGFDVILVVVVDVVAGLAAGEER